MKWHCNRDARDDNMSRQTLFRYTKSRNNKQYYHLWMVTYFMFLCRSVTVNLTNIMINAQVLFDVIKGLWFIHYYFYKSSTGNVPLTFSTKLIQFIWFRMFQYLPFWFSKQWFLTYHMALNGINDADMKAPQKGNNKQRRSVRFLNIGRSPYVIIL